MNNPCIKTSCAACNNTHSNTALSCKSDNKVLKNSEYFDYIHCSHCRSLTLAQIPRNMNEYYQKYHAQYDCLKRKFKKPFSFIRLMKKYIITNRNFISKLLGCCFFISFEHCAIKALSNTNIKKNSKILDAGCGAGYFVDELTDLGFSNIIGIDKYLIRQQTTNSSKLFNQELYETKGHFDYIIFNHSFEHLENPIQIAEKCDQLLNQGGTLIIRVPNILSFQFKHLQEAWPGIHAPFHYLLPSIEGIKAIFEKTSLKLVETRKEIHLKKCFIHSKRLISYTSKLKKDRWTKSYLLIKDYLFTKKSDAILSNSIVFYLRTEGTL